MAIFENLEFLIIVSLFAPMAICVGLTYRATTKNYGAIVNQPIWRKIVSAVIGEIFFLFVIAIYFFSSPQQEQRRMIIWISILFCIIVLVIGKFGLRVIRWLKEKRANGQPIENLQEELPPSKDDQTASEYIFAVLSVVSPTVFVTYIIVSAILRLIEMFTWMESTAIFAVLVYVDATILVVSCIAVVTFAYKVLNVLFKPREISKEGDKRLNEIKEYLSD